MAVLKAVRSTGRRGWPAGGHTPPITVARAIVWALINAAKNIISATTKMIMARTELGRSFPPSGARWAIRDSMVAVGLLIFGTRACTGLHCLIRLILFPIQSTMLHHVRGYARK